MREPFASSSTNKARGTGFARRENRVLARSHAMRTVLLCLLALIPPRVAEAQMLTEQVSRRVEPSQGWYGLEFGPTFSLPLPTASANHDEIGLDVGLSCTAKPGPTVGIGVDAAYGYWPVSTEFKKKFNELLSDRTFNTLMLGGRTWGIQVIQLGGHVRVAAPTLRGARPWLQVGAGAYLVDPNTSGYSGNAGFFTVAAPPLKRSNLLGCSVTVGTDLFGGPLARMGLDVTYRFVDSRGVYGENLQVVTVGVHLLVGW